jgi:hypothetical protein
VKAVKLHVIYIFWSIQSLLHDQYEGILRTKQVVYSAEEVQIGYVNIFCLVCGSEHPASESEFCLHLCHRKRDSTPRGNLYKSALKCPIVCSLSNKSHNVH